MPIFHVNGDDPEACVRVAELAFEYREQFDQDVIIDMVCYRRRGHNEGDDPSMTQPLMYNLIEAKRSVRKLYTETLVAAGTSRSPTPSRRCRTTSSSSSGCSPRQAALKRPRGRPAAAPLREAEGQGPGAPRAQARTRASWSAGRPPSTPSSSQRIGDAYVTRRQGFTVHPKLAQLLAKREADDPRGRHRLGLRRAAGVRVAAASRAPPSGSPGRTRAAARSCSGTRSSRPHTGAEWTPLLYLSADQAKFWVYDSLLSEYAALGFEYGYSVERPDALVLWEAQFGDFVNGAQTIIDEFISSAEQKWAQRSSVVLLLPHGYEGQGPDHSSARIERFLQMCAEDNMTIAQPSTPASHFHLLRRQAYDRPRRPLIVFTPKSMLRLKAASSACEDFTVGHVPPGHRRRPRRREGRRHPRAALLGQGLLGPARRTA